MPKRKPSIKTGTGAKRVKRSAYPFDTLEKPTDWFAIEGREKEASLRSQASKQQKARGVKYSVNRVEKGVDPYKLKRDGLVVIFDHFITN